MITLPGGLQVCRDCMQRSFDMMMGSGMDWTKMSEITPELLKNMYLNPMGSGDGAQKPENTGTAAGKKDDVSEAEKQNSVDNPTEADTDEDAEQTVVDADETEDSRRTVTDQREFHWEIFSESRWGRSTSAPSWARAISAGKRRKK